MSEVLSNKEYVDEKLRQRGVWFLVETYNSVNVIEYACSRARDWAYILHDKDVHADGTPVVPHYHVILHYEVARSGHAVLRDFVGEENSMVQICTHPVASFEYLTHLNHPDKYQYDSRLIVLSDVSYWTEYLPRTRDRPLAVDKEVEFINDLLGEKEPNLLEMARKYGRDFMKNYRSYLDFRDSVKFQNNLIRWSDKK